MTNTTIQDLVEDFNNLGSEANDLARFIERLKQSMFTVEGERAKRELIMSSQKALSDRFATLSKSWQRVHIGSDQNRAREQEQK